MTKIITKKLLIVLITCSLSLQAMFPKLDEKGEKAYELLKTKCRGRDMGWKLDECKSGLCKNAFSDFYSWLLFIKEQDKGAGTIGYLADETIDKKYIPLFNALLDLQSSVIKYNKEEALRRAEFSD